LRIVNKFLTTSVLVLLCVFFLTASVPSVPTGTWQSWNPMGDVRSGAAAVLLQDGRVLISGGSNTAGPTASADLFDTNGAFTATAPMNSARSGHTATLLGDGRVLVSGGDTGSGITNSAEVYDPAAGSWTLLSATLLDARAGHTASLLTDGRVLFAGGHNSGGALSTLEIFDPLNDDFTSAGTLTANRMNHAAAVLGDGRVLVIGGTADGTNALATVDIYDPVTRTVGVGPSLSTPRMSATATTTLDGKVAVIGGSNGSQDIASAEVFDPATGQIIVSASNLATPRSGHNAFLLPNNNSVLIVGGTSGGADLNSAELYFPWADSFQTTGAMTTARPGMTGSALGLDGRFLATGGTNLASTELYGFATVKTDAADYPPGSTVTITGSGWQPGETVALTLVESPLFDSHGPYDVIADGNGNISDSSFVPDEHDLNIRFYLTAVGSQSGAQAQNTFTDAKPNTVTVGTQSPNPVAPGSSAAYTITVNFNGNGNSCTSPLSVSTALPTGATASFSPGSVTSTGGNVNSTLTITTTNATPAGSTTFTVLAANGGGTCQAGTASNTGTLVVVESTTTTLTSSVNPSVFGQSTTLTATVAQITGPTTPTGGTVTFLDGATSLGTATLSAGTASISAAALTAGPHSLTASYAGVANSFGASTSAAVTQAVNNANTTTTVSNASGTFGGPNVTLSANVTANSPSTATVSEGTVTFTVKQGATTIGTVTSGTVAAGTATASFSLSSVNAGTYTINATYNPAATTPNFNTSTAASPGTLTVSPANTTTTVGSSSGTTGGSANLTANVTAVSPSTATVNEGTVTFTVKQGATTIGTATSGTVASGAASVSFPLSGAVSGTYSINATYNPAATPNFNTSTAATAGTLTVNNPVPTTTSISPTSKNVGDATFTLTVNGTNFVTDSVVNFSGSPRITSFVSATQVTASIPASDLTAAGTFNITVTNSAPGGGTSNAQTFTVNNPVPTTTTISPSTKTAGDAGFTLTVNGTNFVNTSTVNFNGSARTTTFVTATQVTAAITAADVANAGPFPVTVTNPAPGGGTSNAQTLTVNPKLAFSTNAFATLIGLCSPQISVQLQNGNGSAATLATPTTLNLSSNSGGGAFFSDAACTTPATTALIAANASTGSFFYKDTVIGSPVITVAATGSTSIQQTEEFTNLRFNTGTFSVQTNACSSAISLQSADAQTGSPTSLTQATTITLSSSSATGKFYSNAACTTQIVTTLISPAIDGGHDTNNFFYKDPAAGAPALTASAGTALAQQTESVVAPPSISKSFGAASIPANGTTSLSFTITNPAANTVSLTGIAFSDTLPAGMIVATPNGLTGTCGGGTITAVAGSGAVSLSGATLAANASCTFSVNVNGTSTGLKSNTTAAVTSTNGGTGNTASASLTVTARTTATTISPLTASTPVGTGTNFIITVMDTDSGPPSNPMASVAVTSTSSPTNSDSISACTLAQGANPAGTVSCQVTVTPTTPFAVHTINASYVATDGVHANSSTAAGAALTVFNPDTTAPVITVNFTAVDGMNGWYKHSPVLGTVSANDTTTGNSNVSAISCTDGVNPLPVGTLAGIGTPTASGSLSVSGDGAHNISCTATDSAGNSGASAGTAGTPVQVKIDTAPPTGVVGVASRAADHNGWYTSAVTVNFSGTDSTSGIASCTSTPYSGPDSETASVLGHCTDNAGNSSGDMAFNFKYDATAPTAVALSVTAGTAGANGWYTSDVTVRTSGTELVSGPPTCTLDQFQTTETAGQVFNGSCTNDAGLTANALALTVKLDKTGPTAGLSITAGTLGNNGWYVTDVTVHAAGADSISNPVVCTADQLLTTDSTGHIFSGSCTNDAGLSTNATDLTVKRDATPPTVHITPDRLADHNGWYNHALTFTNPGTDSTSGIQNCSTPAAYSGPDSMTASVSATCKDYAGNTGNGSFGFQFDSTPPTSVSGDPNRSPDHNTWYNHAVDVVFTGTDATSGIDACTNTNYSGPDSTSASAMGHCTDNAGNTSSPDVSSSAFKFDSTPPTAILAVTAGTLGSHGWYTGDVTVGTSGSDTVSNPTTCTANQLQTAETTGATINGQCTNDAGLTANATPLTVKLDKTAPTGVTLTPSGTVGMNNWYTSNVTIQTSGIETISSPIVCTADQSQTTDTTGQAFHGSCTNDAGLSANATDITIKRDATPPVLTLTFTPDSPDGNNGWWKTPGGVPFTWICSDPTAGVDAGYNGGCPSLLTGTVAANGTTNFNLQVRDQAGNLSVVVDRALKLDNVAPTITLLSRTPVNANGWNKTDVSLSWSCSDATSLAVSDHDTKTVMTEGLNQSSTGNCQDFAGNTSSNTQSGINIDKTPPTVTPITPPAGSPYLLNQAVTPAFTCSDTLSGFVSSGTNSTSGRNTTDCTGPATVDTSSIGPHSYGPMVATDKAGNVSVPVTTSYNINYNFVGFLQPTDNLPVINTANAGRTIPVKWQLKDANGVLISDVNSLTSLLAAPMACGSAPVAIVEEQLSSPGSTVFRFDGVQFIYNWQTIKNWSGCWVLQTTLNDGTMHYAKFQFK
jgi:large repetitive protein